jgi:hypothetical protein
MLWLSIPSLDGITYSVKRRARGWMAGVRFPARADVYDTSVACYPFLGFIEVCGNSYIRLPFRKFIYTGYNLWWLAVNNFALQFCLNRRHLKSEHIYLFMYLFIYLCGGVVGGGTTLQAGKSRDRFPMRSSDFSIDLILLAALWSWGRPSL